MLCIIGYAVAPVFSQNPDTGTEEIKIPIQEIIARVDVALRTPSGLLTGRMTAIQKTGETAIWDFNLYRKKNKMLFQFSSRRRGLEAKVLFLDEGEEIWLWDALRNQLFRKRDLEKYERILGTGFSYVDLSGYSFQANYNGRRVVLFKSGGKNYTRLTIEPIVEGSYAKLELLADQTQAYRPIRIDFHGRDTVLSKTMNFYYDSDVLMRKTGTTAKLSIPSRLEMVDLNNGAISRYEILSHDETVDPGDPLFDPDFLNR